MTDILFQPYQLNDTLTLKNRIAMAPLTRCMADDDLIPTEAMVKYYERRAEAGLIITEATIIRPDGQGYPNTPGLFTAEQIAGWQKVTQAVHGKGGKIFAQLWHTGRVAHPAFFGGDVLAPSAIRFDGSVPRRRDLEYVTPKAATHDDIAQLVRDYAAAAKNALEAGFDGVEIHAANGYLLDQFLHFNTNHRHDEFGESAVNMARFPLQVVDAVCQAISADRVGIRLSPGAYMHIEPDARDRDVFDYLLSELNSRQLAYVHEGIFDDAIEFDAFDGQISAYLRDHYAHTVMGVGNYTAESAAEAIAANKFDLIAIGRAFIANPDYVERVKSGTSLKEYDASMLEDLV